MPSNCIQLMKQELMTRPKIIFDQVAPGATAETKLIVDYEQVMIDCGGGTKGTVRVYDDCGRLVAVFALTPGITMWPCWSTGLHRLVIRNLDTLAPIDYTMTFVVHTSDREISARTRTFNTSSRN